MNYLSNYRKRVGLGAKSEREFTLNEAERNFLQYLETHPTSHEVPMTRPDEVMVNDTTNVERIIINDISFNDKKALDEKKVLTRKDSHADIGSMFFWDNSYWILIYKEHKSVNTSKKFVAKRCNQIFNYKYKGTIYKIPISIDNLTIEYVA